MAFECDQAQVNNKSFKVQSAERASVYVSIPDNSREGSCGIKMVRWPGAGPEETNEKLSGTPEAFAVPDNSPHFAVSSSSVKLPHILEMSLIGEGEMNFIDIAVKLGQGVHSGKNMTAQILLVADSIKCVQDDKEVFSATPATLKSVDQITGPMGGPTEFFRIVLTNGKIYNFSRMNLREADQAVKLIKKLLGK